MPTTTTDTSNPPAITPMIFTRLFTRARSEKSSRQGKSNIQGVFLHYNFRFVSEGGLVTRSCRWRASGIGLDPDLLTFE